MVTIRPEAIRADMRFLADNLLEGRGTATRGHELAAKFMAAQFEQMGFEPAGDSGTYFQRVPLRWARADGDATSVTIVRNGREERLLFRQDYITSADPARGQSSVEAPVVFVGRGVTAPEHGYDDYQGIDARGKIVAMLSGAPNFEPALKAHYSSGIVKQANAVAHGAVGRIVLFDPAYEERYPFNKRVRDLAFPDMRWLDRQGGPNDYFATLQGQAVLSLEAAKRLFDVSGHTAEEVFTAAKEDKPLSFALPMTARIHNATKLRDVSSPNVVAKLEGRDPLLRREYVVFSAHLDHLGIGEPMQGDSIYHGARDNASGSAALLEIARAFSHMHPRPRRSILFLSVTGEEEGLLGSDYFAHYPTVEKSSMVADVNMDGTAMLWPLEDVVGIGAEHSTLNSVVRQAAARMHLVVSPDPRPEEVFFIRSDQYSFVKQGIPAVFPAAGFKSNDPSIDPRALATNWLRTRYHTPQDDMDQPGLHFDIAAQFARFVFLAGYLLAEQRERPRWNKGDFFGELYGKNAK